MVLKYIREIGIVPVVQLSEPGRDAVRLAKALRCGGLPVVEVTFRTARAPEAIERIVQSDPEMVVGAGTILTVDQAEAAIAAGAHFLVMPGFDPELVAYCQSKNILVLPGCSSASEYQIAHRMGLRAIKFFPAEQSGGIEKIKALSAPFPMMQVMPTGGISLSNLASYLSLPMVLACGGSYIAAPALLEEQAWDVITERCRKSLNIVKEVRRNA